MRLVDSCPVSSMVQMLVFDVQRQSTVQTNERVVDMARMSDGHINPAWKCIARVGDLGRVA